MEDQIKINVEADEIVGDIISSALRYLTTMSRGQFPQAEPYFQALESIKVTDPTLMKVTDIPAKLPSPYLVRKSVTFGQIKFPESHSSREPRTPGPDSRLSFTYVSSSDDEIEITRL